MENQTNSEKCIFCGCDELLISSVSLSQNPQSRKELPVFISKDGSPSYRYGEYLDFTVKRCSKCNYVHLFHIPDQFKPSAIK